MQQGAGKGNTTQRRLPSLLWAGVAFLQYGLSALGGAFFFLCFGWCCLLPLWVVLLPSSSFMFLSAMNLYMDVSLYIYIYNTMLHKDRVSDSTPSKRMRRRGNNTPKAGGGRHHHPRREGRGEIAPSRREVGERLRHPRGQENGSNTSMEERHPQRPSSMYQREARESTK